MRPKKEFINGTLQGRQLAFLNDTVAFYNAGNRCTNIAGYCRYSANQASPGCAIGRWLPKRLAMTLDTSYIESAINNKEIFSKVPKWMQNLGKDFLAHVQKLHDSRGNWNSEGISNKGKKHMVLIKQTFNL